MLNHLMCIYLYPFANILADGCADYTYMYLSSNANGSSHGIHANKGWRKSPSHNITLL